MQPDVSTESRKWWAMLGIGMGVFMSTLDSSIVNISLPTLVETFDTTFPIIQWVILSYLLVNTTLMLGVARLGDMIGKKKIYVTGLVIFTIGSLLCAFSPDVGWLIGFRGLQGIGAVMMTAMGAAIITEVFPPSQRGQALGIMGATVSIGIAVGPTIGGILIGLVSWHSIFLINIPVGIVTVAIVSRVVPESPPIEGEQQFDIAGAVITFVTLVAYAVGMTLGQQEGFNNWVVLILLGGALVGLIIFLIIESSIDQPMVDLSLFRNVLFGVNLLMMLLVFIVLSSQFLLPFFLELVQSYPTEQVGMMIAIMPVSMGVVAPLAGTLSDRFGVRLISLIGLVIVGMACLLVSTVHADITVGGYLLRLGPLGIGIGIFMSPNNSAILGAVPRERLGIASGLRSLARTLAQSSGLPLMGALFASQVTLVEALPSGVDITEASPAALVFGIQNTYRIAAFIILAATALAAFALWFDNRQQKQSAIEQQPE